LYLSECISASVIFKVVDKLKEITLFCINILVEDNKRMSLAV